FGSFFVHCNERFVENLRDVEVIVQCPWRDLIEIRAAFRLIERSFHPERFKLRRQRNGRRFQFELWQMKVDVTLVKFRAPGEHVRVQFRFEVAQPINVVRQKNDELQLVASVRNRYDSESFASSVTEIRSFSHQWNIDRCAANKERFGLRRVLGKLTRPRCFQVKPVRLVLANGLYLKAPWASEFSRTKNGSGCVGF